MTHEAHGPAVGAQVRVVLARGRHADATVDDRGPGWFDLDVATGSLPVGGDDLRATLEFAGAQGTGHVTGRIARSPVPGIYRFTHTARPAVERRPEFVRAHVAAPLLVRRLGPAGHPRRAVTSDITGAGLTVRGLDAATPGALYAFELELPGQPLVEGQFRVQSADGDVASVVFTVLSATDRATLVRYASDHRVRRGHAV